MHSIYDFNDSTYMTTLKSLSHAFFHFILVVSFKSVCILLIFYPTRTRISDNLRYVLTLDQNNILVECLDRNDVFNVGVNNILDMHGIVNGTGLCVLYSKQTNNKTILL